MSDTTAQTKTIKLLLVNDSECERRMNAEYIQKRIPDILIFQASDLGRANELILTEKPQLVISDLVMPRGTYKCQVADSDDGKAENTRKWHKNIRKKGRHIATSSGFGSNDNAIPYLLNAQEMVEWITTKKEQIEKGVDQKFIASEESQEALWRAKQAWTWAARRQSRSTDDENWHPPTF